MKAREKSKSESRHHRNGFVRTFGLVPTVFVLAVVLLLLWQPITAAPADGESVRAVKTAAVASQAIAMTAVGTPATQPPLAVRQLAADVVDEPRATQRPKKDAAPDPPSRSNTCPATNVGVRPTFGAGPRTVEAHIMDFDRDIYGKSLTLEFSLRLRDELSFDTVDALIQQMKLDVEQARAVLSAASTLPPKKHNGRDLQAGEP